MPTHVRINCLRLAVPGKKAKKKRPMVCLWLNFIVRKRLIQYSSSIEVKRTNGTWWPGYWHILSWRYGMKVRDTSWPGDSNIPGILFNTEQDILPVKRKKLILYSCTSMHCRSMLTDRANMCFWPKKTQSCSHVNVLGPKESVQQWTCWYVATQNWR